MKITSIKQQEKRKDRYSIFVEGKYSFSLSEGALLDNRLVSGMELNKEKLKQFKKLSKDEKAYGNALRYAAMRSRSIGEMKDYLRRKQIEEPTINTILEKLQAIGLLDDAAFARTWIDNRRLLKPISKRRLVMELKQKHVSDDIISTAMEENSVDELSVLRELVEKKKKISKYHNDPQKLMQYLARQGFGYDDIKTALGAVDSEDM